MESPGWVGDFLNSLRGFFGSAGRGLGALRRRLHAWRRIRFTRGGLVFTLGSFAVGFVAFHTGNNLLYLLFGSMLGLIVVSGWLSEQVIRNLRVHRRVPRGVTVGNPIRIQYEVANQGRRIPSFALEVGEPDLPGHGFVPMVPPGERVVTRSENTFVQRGVFPLRAVQISTTFPFGLFRKSREIQLEDEIVVWPRSDRRVQPPEPEGGRISRAGSVTLGSAGLRGEYRGLRSYRPGDDPRDIHWRTTARLGHPVVREYEEGDTDALWFCLDLRGDPGVQAEVAVEMVASLAARAFQEGRRFAFHAPTHTVEAGLGPGQLERILGALARVDFSPGSPRLSPPRPPQECIVVTLQPAGHQGFGDLYVPPRSSLAEEVS